MADELPEPFTDFAQRYPDVHAAYEALAEAAHVAGPLTERERRLVKLGIAIGGRLEGAVRSHARQARAAGVSRDAIDHAALLALTTIGLPSTVAARSWIADALLEG